MTEVSTEIDNVLVRELKNLRRPLLGFCYRMLGSAYEAEDSTHQPSRGMCWQDLVID